MAGGKFVEVSEVSRRFRTPEGEVHALDSVSFDVRAGEFLSIVGPSGCGKSTLVMIIAGLMPPTGGVITIGGLVVDRPQTNLGIVFQSPVLLAWRSALGNVLLQLEMRGLDAAAHRERARALLASVGPLASGDVALALQTTFSTRKTHDLPRSFPDPPKRWETQYASLAEENDLRWATLAEVTAAARAFLQPLLEGRTGTWDPATWRWK